MKVTVLAIGKPRSKPVQALVENYSARIRHYLPFEITAYRDDAQAAAKVEPGDFAVLLDERGEQMRSVELAALISEKRSRSVKRLVFMIGGEDGAGEGMRGRANLVMSLSKMTFPHELVQALLAEQLYRACSINRGEPYHRE